MINMEKATIRIPGTNGDPGKKGKPGDPGVQPEDPNGTNGSCKKRCCSTKCNCSGPGKPGGNAPTNGDCGLNGGAGETSPSFTLRADTITGPLVIFSLGGAGGDGGKGGDGGNGAIGGNAGQFDDSCAKSCLGGSKPKCNFADGGVGGNGSDGGNGGKGGNAGDGGLVEIYYKTLSGGLQPLSQGGSGGGFGPGSMEGKGGVGGKNEIYPGSDPNFAADGTNGTPGSAGSPGESGNNGTVRVVQIPA